MNSVQLLKAKFGSYILRIEGSQVTRNIIYMKEDYSFLTLTTGAGASAILGRSRFNTLNY